MFYKIRGTSSVFSQLGSSDQFSLESSSRKYLELFYEAIFTFIFQYIKMLWIPEDTAT